MSKKIMTLAIICLSTIWSISAMAQEVVRYSGSGVMLRAIMYRAATEFKEKEGIEVNLEGKDTIHGINKLLAGEADITGGGRALTPEERAKGLVEKKLFLDARAFITNKRVPVDSLTTEQISDILLGKITNWNKISDLKYSRLVIVSPSQTTEHYRNQQKINGFKELPEGTIYCERTPDVFNKVKAEAHNTIGFLSNSNIKEDEDVKIITIKVNGEPVPMTQDNVASGKYPYVQSMYFYTMGEPKGNAKKLLDFMASEQGLKIITEAGFFLPL
ncbi:MAG: substrate-binding domain-containing protein [Desulfobulbaceae bacterium]|nr:substrate-binding domain-containing protein [Desulfobulbaceae bacterium]